MEAETIDRRVYRPELAKLMGCSPEWLRRLERDGRIPGSRRDPGGRRVFWLASEVQSILQGRKAAEPQQHAA